MAGDSSSPDLDKLELIMTMGFSGKLVVKERTA